MRVLAVDQGTSATKALVVGDGGEVLASAEVPVHPNAIDGGGVEQEPEELWRSVVDAGNAALAAAPPGTTVDGVALANQGETVLPWDRDSGAPLGDCASCGRTGDPRMCASASRATAGTPSSRR